jgi:tetratricopeptide (TPR) repeat protein
MFAVDGSPGKAYTPTGWELWAPLVPLYDSGQYAELIAQLTRVINADPRYPMLVYNLGCAEGLSDQTGDAFEHLRQAVDAEEKVRDHAGRRGP